MALFPLLSGPFLVTNVSSCWFCRRVWNTHRSIDRSINWWPSLLLSSLLLLLLPCCSNTTHFSRAWCWWWWSMMTAMTMRLMARRGQSNLCLFGTRSEKIFGFRGFETMIIMIIPNEYRNDEYRIMMNIEWWLIRIRMNGNEMMMMMMMTCDMEDETDSVLGARYSTRFRIMTHSFQPSATRDEQTGDVVTNNLIIIIIIIMKILLILLFVIIG